MTTQSPHLYARTSPRAASRAPAAGAADRGAGRGADGVQTRLPWWAVALPVAAFAVLLALLSGAAPSGAADAASGADVLARAAAALQGFFGHLL